MRKLIILYLCCSITYVSKAQDAKAILKFAFEKCQNIKSGHFVNHYVYKSWGDPERQTKSSVTFKKTDNDTVSPCLFYAQNYFNTQSNKNSLYTGKEYISFFTANDAGEIISAEKYASDAFSRCRSDFYQFFEPFLAKNSAPLPKYSDLDNSKIAYNLVGIETVNGFKCWHVQFEKISAGEFNVFVKSTKNITDFWINTKDSIPVQYCLTAEINVGNETQINTRKIWLESYEFDNLISDALFKPTAVPKYVRLIEFVPKPKMELLKAGTTAPSFKIKTIEDKTIKLKDLKGKVVILFFYIASNYSIGKSPLVGLQGIHEKYPNTEIILFNCSFSGDIDGMKLFAASKNISLPMSIDYEGVKKDYQVATYPVYYLIDENGKIFTTFWGYSNIVTEKRVEAALEKHLSLNINKQ